MNLRLLICLLIVGQNALSQPTSRIITDFNDNWKFTLKNATGAEQIGFNDANWRSLSLPHDWSIELPFDKESPTGTGGGALRGGTGWYRKTFTLPALDKSKKVFIEFDGVYMNSEVFINGHSLGKRPNGYIGFRYELTPYLKARNILAVKVDNSQQPNSRWYSGSGIYRNVWLITTNDVFVDHWGTYITTPGVSDEKATVVLQTRLNSNGNVVIQTSIYNAENTLVQTQQSTATTQQFTIRNPHLWSVNDPYLYKAKTQLLRNGKIIDEYTTHFGIRYFNFDVEKGFFLNGKHVKIRGVCNHHDLGCLGTAINTRALERQLEILKAMGCNGIRTSHNPPAPELLDLCDKMGFIVMDEAFDMWKKQKTKFDYHLNWDEWHKKDLEDQLLRDRNHPSVFMWSVGNEIQEQWGNDTSGRAMIRELTSIVKSLDSTRPVVTGNNHTGKNNHLVVPGAPDMIGFNYHHHEWLADTVFNRFGQRPFIVTESVSALQTRGHYDMPSDSIRRWPKRWDAPVENANPDTTCSAYDNCSAPWGSTHEETIKVFEKYDHISGMYIWTGFDYIGEPTPYPWPARSSYFGIIDLAGFPKDVYYMYQSVWTDRPVLHIFPHWNWKPGDTVDVWAYYNNADEVELFVNDQSKGVRRKQADEYHVMWRLPFTPGTVKAVSRKNGKTVLTKTIQTAGAPARIVLQADRKNIRADGKDLCFITVRITDQAGNLVPDANNLVQFTVKGAGTITAVDNGSQTSMESFQAGHRKAFKGLCLAVLKSAKKTGAMELTATSTGLPPASITITVK
jgi:beta-galactosidase